MTPRATQRLLWAVLAVALLAAGVFAFLKWQNRPVYRKLDDFGAVPAFSLRSQDGAPVALADYGGHIWVANLFFTRCVTICPVLSMKMSGLQQSLAGDTSVKLVSFSADPQHDVPDTLRAYAARYKANPRQWTFLTGPVADIYSIAKTGFHLPIDSVGGEQDPPIIHSARFVLVDGRGHIRGYYNGSEPTAQGKVLADITALKHEAEQ